MILLSYVYCIWNWHWKHPAVVLAAHVHNQSLRFFDVILKVIGLSLKIPIHEKKFIKNYHATRTTLDTQYFVCKKKFFKRCTIKVVSMRDKQVQLFQLELHNNIRLLHMQGKQRVLVKKVISNAKYMVAAGHFFIATRKKLQNCLFFVNVIYATGLAIWFQKNNSNVNLRMKHV